MRKEIMPGDRVLVFDSRLYIDDVKTPIEHTMRQATVVCRYGCYGYHGEHTRWRYPDLCDVVFDHRPESVSKGHFTDGIRLLEDE